MKNFFKSRDFKLLIFTIVFGLGLRIFGAESTLDRKFFYTMVEGDQWLHGQTDAELERYIVHEYLDTLFLISFSAVFFALMGRVTILKSLRFLALLPGVFDLVETWTILAVLHESICIPEWLGYVTAIKWCLAYLVIGVLLVGWWRKHASASV